VESVEAQRERAERPAAMGLDTEARLVVERAVVVRIVVADFAAPIVASEDAARAGKFREQAQPMTSLRKL
jgi:hypothetical protein